MVFVVTLLVSVLRHMTYIHINIYIHCMLKF